MKRTTAIVNHTNGVLKVKVGSPLHTAYLASIDKGGQWDLQVDLNETYREFRLQDPAGTTTVVVTSDDCCDNECITIKDAAAAGDGRGALLRPKFEVLRVPRRALRAPGGSSPGMLSQQAFAAPEKRSDKLTWFGWLRRLWAPSPKVAS